MTDTAKFHDMGGRPNDDPIDRGEHVLMDWERRIDSIRGILGERGYLVVDELRRAIEDLPPSVTRPWATTNVGPRPSRPYSSKRASSPPRNSTL